MLEILDPGAQPLRARKPPWFKVPAARAPRYRELQSLIKAENLDTVCQDAAYVARMGLRHAVITSVERDDLADR